MKNKVRNILILAFLVFISFYYGSTIKSNALVVNDAVVEGFYGFTDYLKDKINEHFNQAEQIRILREQNKNLEEASVLLSTFANQLNLILEDKNSTQYFPQISLVRAISYVQVGDYDRLWLSSTSYNFAKSKGLIYKGYTAGVVVLKDRRPMAILQGDEQCVFSVAIGTAKVPGIVQGQNGKVVIKFIPKWDKVNIGDEVLTSGLDEIFFAGIPVGKVTKIIDEDMYQSAELEPFVKVEIPSYMYMIESL